MRRKFRAAPARTPPPHERGGTINAASSSAGKGEIGGGGGGGGEFEIFDNLDARFRVFFILHTYEGGSEMCRNERVEEVGGNNGCMWGGGGRGFTQGQLQDLRQFQLFMRPITEERKGSLL